MSGHNKWASIKHKKAATDAKRGNLFTKLVREITVAAKTGGGDPEMNPRLRSAIDSAKSANMPNDNIKKAIQRGTGELPGVSYEELVYEGYGPGGVAVLVEITTDNKNRIASGIRKTFSRFGGSLGENGCVAWMFDQKGTIEVEKKSISEEELMEIVLEAGAEDIDAEDTTIFEIITNPENFESVKKALSDKNINYASASISKVPQTTIALEGKQAEQMLKLMEELDSNDDVQNVYANFDISDEVMDSIK
ncbi:YebC/PmpR family DNA-binding transcriptional regulator [bacterium]